MNIFNGQFKGLSDSAYSGLEGSFSKSVGIDGHSTPGVLKVAQALASDSLSTITELCKVAVSASNGYKFWFSSVSGKIWAELNGVYTLAYTTVPGAGDADIRGAEEYDGYIYWATGTKLHRIAIANADDAWASVSLDWATLTDVDYHPFIVQNSTLFIGDGNVIAQVSNRTGSHVFTASVKTLVSPLQAKTFLDYDIDILIGTYTPNVNKAQVLRWDTTSDSLSTSDAVDENGVNAFIRDVNNVYVQCGSFGSIYLYNGQELQSFKRIPGDYSDSQTVTVNPNSTGVHATIPVFGVSGSAVENGLYRLGSYSASYETALDLTYPVSAGLENVTIGAILSEGTDLYVSWSTSIDAGVDKLDWSTKYSSAYIETPFISPLDERSVAKQLNQVIASYSNQPDSTSVGFSYRLIGGEYQSLASTTDTDLNLQDSSVGVSDYSNLQVKIEFTTLANNAPELDSITIS